MADKPILFSGPMVRALIAGTKTQTRRLCDLPEPSAPIIDMVKVATDAKTGRAIYEMKDAASQHVTIREGRHFVTPNFSPRIAVGDRLYVRETFSGLFEFEGIPPREWPHQYPLWYWADGNPQDGDWTQPRPGIHMPRWASRLTLTVTDVRVERLQDISEADAAAEGVKPWPLGENLDMPGFGSIPAAKVPAKTLYCYLWDHINGLGSWEANPWVAAYTFSVERGNIDQLGRAA